MLTIGQMARILNVTPKTLRHYDSIGLFSPCHIGADNQYRYYTSEQVNQLRRILFLRSMGMGLEVIRGLIQSGAIDDPERLKAILQEHADTIRAEISKQQELLHSVEEMIENIDHTRGMHMKAKIVTRNEFTVVGMEHKSDSGTGNIGELWQRFLKRQHEIEGKVNPNVCYGVFYMHTNDEYTYVAGYEANMEKVPNGMVKITVPTQKYAVFTHVGSVANIAKTIESIYGTWLPQQGLNPINGIDFAEMNFERFVDPQSETSEIDLYIPIE
ncbi:MerR family transcriptional regulator [Alicyclobacillus shizuokensis]|uniref:MerR family transcriptional regulator n=1 Tax=Alicyclobacillus shizuokensis TaxID=392014 RepID=UPI00082BDAEC|nr:effector binding domain-containing protein [Alicyclobacillus shizuokensis]